MKKIKLLNLLPAVLFPVFYYASSYAEVKLPALFSDNMVLQQQTEVAIWGWAEEGGRITVVPSWSGEKYTENVDPSGKWKVKIVTPLAGGPYEITISDGEALTLKNVLIGEVWVCSGQSNMEMPMKGYRDQPVAGSNDAILRSKNKNIRLFTVPRASTTEPQEDCTARWDEAVPATVSNFSATAWYFGKLLHEILDVPVGLINTSYGGSTIEAWMNGNSLKGYDDIMIPGKGDSIPVKNRTPTVLFNGMLYPVIGYGIRGCIWYQGESNTTQPERYGSLLEAMVREWRTLWGIGEFPFYYTQIAPYNYTRNSPNYSDKDFNSAYLRDAQRKAMDKIPNCGMAVLMDTGEENCIHPANKEAAGNRLAYWALAKTYGIEGIGYASPAFRSMTVQGSEAIVTFDNAPNGLTSFGKKLSCFEIAGADKRFYPADAVLSRSTVIVSSPDVKVPVAVRYAFKDFITGDLFGTEGLPVSSFRTDNW